jgi:hypothetical protein
MRRAAARLKSARQKGITLVVWLLTTLHKFLSRVFGFMYMPISSLKARLLRM